MTDQEQVILKAIQYASRGGVALISDVLRVVGYPKTTSKKILIDLAGKGIVFLHRHDYPGSLSPADRKLMIRWKGNYYNAVSVLKKNPRGQHLPGLPKKAQREYEHVLKSERAMGRSTKRAKQIAAGKVRKDYAPARRRKNITVIKAKKIGKVTVLKARNASKKKATKRRRNLDHPDSSHPVMVHKHWRSGGLSQWQRAHKAGQKPLFEHGIKARNPLIQPGRRYKMKADYEPTAIIEVGMRGGFKAVFIAKDGLAGQVGGFKTRQEAAAWAKAQGFKVVQKTKKRNAARASHPKSAKASRAGASRKGRKASTKPRKRVHKRNATPFTSLAKKAVKAVKKVLKKKRNPSPASIRKNFAGRYSKDDKLVFPDGTPQGLAKLGKLVSIDTDAGEVKPVKGTAWLCSDTKGKLHIGTPTKGRVVFQGPATNFGYVREIEYEERKPHLGRPNPTIYFHKLGEETGVKPRLVTDGKGGAKFVGGQYRIKREGIIN